MLTAYLDESGHETRDVVIIAGFLGNAEQWSCCAERWSKALLPSQSLHLNELRWNKERTRKLLARLGPIPHECGLNAIIGAVRVGDYYDLVAGTQAEKLTKGYALCLLTVMDAILKNTPQDERVELVLEAQHEYKTQAEMIFRSHEERQTLEGLPRLSGIKFIPKESSILTQPADYLAYALLQGFRDQKSKKTQWCQPILQNLKPGFGMVPDREGLRAVIQRTLELQPEFAKPVKKS
jgi:hypothetical protein